MNESPHDMAERRVTMAGEYSRMSEQLSDLLAIKPAIWNELRKDVKSDTACERVWEGSENGIKEMRLKMKMKALEKEMSALSTMLRVYETEARNQF